VTEEDARRVADAVAVACDRAVPGAAVVVHGSLVLGDFVPGRSDVDVLVVSPEPPSDMAESALHETVSSAPGRVDVRVVTAETAASPATEPRLELGLGKHGETGVDVERRVPERDLVVELSVCRAHGRSLRGPAPGDVIGHVPDESVLAVGDEVLADWRRIPFEPQYADLMVFTSCRVWRFREERVHCAKSEAAGWALARDPGLTVVADALALRAGASAVQLDEIRVLELLARASPS
jgi:predicted nucleotidyltransferase